jgi:hypothetical protein
MTSRIDIVNRALVKIGTGRIAALDESSEPARLQAIVFESLAKTMLRRQAWSFSIARSTLGLVAGPPINSWLATYNLPTDCLRLIQYNDYYVDQGMAPGINSADPLYVIEGRQLRSRESTVNIRYVKDLSADTALWDATFVEAFICALAIELCPSLTKDKTKKRELQNDYKDAIAEAKRTNAIELPPQPFPDGSWVLSRFVGGGGAC